jgi:pimeloyl-ACP methyl ester carboxylesterase
MEPRIQYATTTDGVSIAYATAGSGPALVLVPCPPACHALLVPQGLAAEFELLTQRFRVIWYDSRGCGLSDRDAIDFSMDAMIRDLEAVVAACGIDRFALTSFGQAAIIALSAAARFPERVSHLALVDGFAKQSEHQHSSVVQFERSIRDMDWELYTETFARVFWKLEGPAASQFAEFLRACSGPEALRAAYAALEEWDATQALTEILCPTLVLFNPASTWVDLKVEQRFAAAIPGAQFALLEAPAAPTLPGSRIAEFLQPTLNQRARLPACPQFGRSSSPTSKATAR